ncbi:hypothetical protein FVEN_g749 [Fusarium venenatum]|uniref:Uncharacterized protein n=2 Tax=Fusarium venenatum TaxID=56646 RepID=A0A2L2TKZ3_9HYPO|nr:uncharacterized protein FVRRES_10846 [Fusarium venenatum]KAG8361560.1 hypothetical protein FVEN_g749 [Fusarium venenatum]CEI70769.1 unnamed protein product [Fusarium venenatum]
MEAVGLAIGVAGLFSAVLEAAEKVQSYRSFGSDSSTLETRFQTTKVLLEQWGHSVGCNNGVLSTHHSTKLDNPDIEVAVEKILKITQEILQFGLQHRPSHGVIGLHTAGRRQKLKWAFGDKQKQQEKVELFEKLVGQLLHLVPVDHIGPEAIQSHASIAEIQAILQRIETETRAETRKQVLSWIGHGRTDQRYHDSLQKKHAGTCDWIYSREVFQRWLSSDFFDGFKALWINGPAGFGKTVLSASIVNHLSVTFDTPTAHFFVTSESQSRDDPFLAVRAWIAQIISGHQDAFECAHHVWQDDSDPVSSREICLRLLAQIVQLVPGCTFVIDGLDECTNLHAHNTSATAFLEAIIAALSTMSSRVLVVSRDEPHIRHALSTRFIEYTILPSDVHADTISVSQEIVERKLNKKPNDFRKSLSITMAARCEGQFLWLRLQEESLRNGMNMKKLQSVVEGTPPGLEALYEREWSRMVQSPDYERIISLLRWTAFAIRPLTVDEITEAVLIGDYEDFPLDDLPDEIDDDYVDTEIVDLCAPLIQMIHRREEKENDSPVGQQTVHLAHFSVKQFLLTQLPAPVTIQTNGSLRSQYQHSLLATACLQYINFRYAWNDMAGHMTIRGAMLRDYAASSWNHHYHSSLTSDETLLDRITTLFDERNWVWGFWRSWLHMQDSNSFTTSGDSTANGGSDETWWYSESPGPIVYAIGLGLDSIADTLMTEYTSGRGDMKDLTCAAFVVSKQSGRENTLKKLLKSGVSARVVDADGKSLLHFAVGFNSSQFVRILIDSGADVTATDREGFTPLHVARSAEITRILLESGAMVDSRTNVGRTALHSASFNGSAEIVEVLLDMSAAVDARVSVESSPGNFDCHLTPLHLACLAGHLEVARMLIAKGTSLTASNAGVLHGACAEGNKEIVQLLALEGVCIEDSWLQGMRAIQVASECEQFEVVELLIELGANIDVKDENGSPILHVVCQKGHTETMKALINAGADIEELDASGFTPLAVSCYYGHLDAANLLIGVGSDFSRIIKFHGATLLFQAVAKDYTKIARLLLDNGVDLAERHKDGHQALDVAASYGRTQLVELFIEMGANVLGTDKYGRAPLHRACACGNIETVRLLLNAGSRLSSLDNNGFTCLHLASHGDKLEIVNLLVTMGLSISAKAFNGATPLHSAAIQGSIDVVKYLLKEGAFAEEVDHGGLDAIDMATYRGNVDILKCLVEANPEGAINNVRDKFGTTRLHIATYQNRTRSVKSLLDIPGIEPNKVDYAGRTALLLAARHGFDNIVQTLVADVRVNPNLKDWHGSTPLFVAVRYDRSKALKVLLKSPKVTTEDKDGFGKDVWWWAEKTGNLEVLSLLQQYVRQRHIFTRQQRRH